MPKSTRSEIAQAVLQLSQKMSGKKLSQAVASYLVAEHRTSELDAVMREVERLRSQQDKVQEVTITSAYPLSDKVKKQLLDLIEGKKIVNEVIDKSVIGGMRLEANDYLLDLTVRNSITRLKQGVNN